MNATNRMTTEEIENFARTYLPAHPDATGKDVFAAIRDSGYTGLLQSFEVRNACQKVRPIVTINTADEATAFMQDLSDRYEWVSVFWDRGWGDSGQKAEISVIVDGDGQMPLAWLTREVYADLLSQRVIAPNSLQTFKARKLHNFTAAAA